ERGLAALLHRLDSLLRRRHAGDGDLEQVARFLGDVAHDALRLVDRAEGELELVLEPVPVTALAYDGGPVGRTEGAPDLVPAEGDPHPVLPVATDTAADVRDAVVARALEKAIQPGLAERLACCAPHILHRVVERAVVRVGIGGDSLELVNQGVPAEARVLLAGQFE